MTTALLLSGGMDSIALAYWKRPNLCFTIDYGQRCAIAEISAAEKICSELDLQHDIITIDCSKLGSGDLSNHPPNHHAPFTDWWPFRNQLLITIAAMRSIELGTESLLIGSVKSDSGHADGRVEFIRLIDKLLRFQEGNIRIKAPAIDMSTVELVQKSGIPFSLLCWSHSCHTGNIACGACRGCNKHRSSMIDLGYEDY